MTPFPELDSWLAFFRGRRGRVIDLPWSEEVRPPRGECERIARSIATFQLGESSDGANLIAAARAFAERRRLPAIAEITELFIREEQLHAALLAAFMKASEIPLLRSEWSDRVFRSLRRFAGFELAVSVLLVAELIALTYYRALASATQSVVLRQICETIVSDELSHVAYESSVLLRLQRERQPATRGAERVLHSMLYAGAVVVVFAGHRSVLRAGGFAFPRFWAACQASFREFLGRGATPRLAPGGRADPRASKTEDSQCP